MNGNIMQIISEHRKKLCKKVNSYNPNLVIDVGCGPFWSKSHNKIKNVIGFDRENWTKRSDVFALPDLLCTIEEADKIFKSKCADIVMCMGSLHRTNEADIFPDFKIVYGWTRKFLIMRAVWTEEFIDKLTKEYNLVIDGEIENLESKAGMKYWWWKIQ